MIVDLNRQSLDRVIPGIRVNHLEGMFAAANWQVLEAKYGPRLRRLIAGPKGEVLQRRIDEMSNEDYQVLIRREGPIARERLLAGARPADRDDLATVIADVPDEDLPATLADLGGHDIDGLVRLLDEADADRTRPSIVFAYTIKGWRLPFAGDAMNHSAMLSADQIADLAAHLGADPARPWARFAPGTPEARLCSERGADLDAGVASDRPTARAIGRPAPGDRHPSRWAPQHPAGIRRGAHGAVERRGARAPHRHRLPGRSRVDEPRRLGQSDGRLRAGCDATSSTIRRARSRGPRSRRASTSSSASAR